MRDIACLTCYGVALIVYCFGTPQSADADLPLNWRSTATGILGHARVRSAGPLWGGGCAQPGHPR
jgi:hypothetical protein